MILCVSMFNIIRVIQRPVNRSFSKETRTTDGPHLLHVFVDHLFHFVEHESFTGVWK